MRAVPGRPSRAVREVRAGAAPRQDAADRVRAVRRREPAEAGRRETGDVRLSRLHAYLREDAGRAFLGAAYHGLEADAGQAGGGQGPAAAAPASACPGAGAVAGQRGARALRLLRRARQPQGGGGVPHPGDAALAAELRRRSQRSRLDWKRMNRLATRWLPPARVDASLPRRALWRSYPRQEPSALAAHAGICAGGRPQGRSLPRYRLRDASPMATECPYVVGGVTTRPIWRPGEPDHRAKGAHKHVRGQRPQFTQMSMSKPACPNMATATPLGSPGAQTSQKQHAGLLELDAQPAIRRQNLSSRGRGTEGVCLGAAGLHPDTYAASGLEPGTWKDPDPRRRSSRGSGGSE